MRRLPAAAAAAHRRRRLYTDLENASQPSAGFVGKEELKKITSRGTHQVLSAIVRVKQDVKSLYCVRYPHANQLACSSNDDDSQQQVAVTLLTLICCENEFKRFLRNAPLRR